MVLIEKTLTRENVHPAVYLKLGSSQGLYIESISFHLNGDDNFESAATAFNMKDNSEFNIMIVPDYLPSPNLGSWMADTWINPRGSQAGIADRFYGSWSPEGHKWTPAADHNVMANTPGTGIICWIEPQ